MTRHISAPLRRLPPIHALAAFESAARLGGFAAAATELCITPSAVSHRIRQLEARLGEQLFERTPSGVRLTEAGQRCRTVVCEAFDRLASLWPDEAETRQVRLVVGTPPTFARNLLIPLLPEFQRHCPDLQIEVAISAPMQDKPDRHDVDIRFGAEPFDDRPAQRLFADQLDLLATPEMAEQLRLRSPADLSRAELLRSPLLPWRAWFGAAGLDWAEPMRGPIFSDLGILLEAAASGLGLALCGRRIAERWTTTGRLVRLLPEIEVPAPSTYFVLIGPEQARRPEVAAFADWLLATLG